MANVEFYVNLRHGRFEGIKSWFVGKKGNIILKRKGKYVIVENLREQDLVEGAVYVVTVTRSSRNVCFGVASRNRVWIMYKCGHGRYEDRPPYISGEVHEYCPECLKKISEQTKKEKEQFIAEIVAKLKGFGVSESKAEYIAIKAWYEDSFKVVLLKKLENKETFLEWFSKLSIFE